MDFVSNKEIQFEKMLKIIGVDCKEDLWKDIPRCLWKASPLEDDGLSEFEGLNHIEAIASKNQFSLFESYLGAGAYEHHVPALVQAVTSKPEFLTAYTPYQAEASQGMLQAVFEYQSCICALTGMDAANASLYDGASACAEALLMAMRLKHERREILIADSLHPHYLDVVMQYLGGHEVSVKLLPVLPDGSLDLEKVAIGEQTAAILLQYPNFFGVIDPVAKLFETSKKFGIITVLCGNPLAYGLYASPNEVHADIAIGDTQPFGLNLQFGGPYAGYIACRAEYVRQLPGRIVGMTKDAEGKRGFVLTLQTREQHIRREKATSNICTNQALASLSSLVAMLWYGKQGIAKLALSNYQRCAYLKSKLEGFSKVKTVSSKPFFNEFCIELSIPVREFLDYMRSHQIEPGLCLAPFKFERSNQLLIAVTETKSKAQLDRYIQLAGDLLS